jgi:hypothetical protein
MVNMKNRSAKERKARIRMRPKSIPILTNAQFRVVAKEMDREPTEADFKRIERVKQVLKNNLP